MLTDKLFQSWADCFNSLDIFIEEVLKKHPEMEKHLDRKPIHTAVKETQKLATILERAKAVSNEKQRTNKTTSK